MIVRNGARYLWQKESTIESYKSKQSDLREWGNDVTAYNRYEATPYLALRQTF